VKPVRILHDGSMVDADELTFVARSPAVANIAEAEVEDGAKVECRFQLTNLFRLRDAKQADGATVYIVMAKVETKVTPPTKTTEAQ